MAKRNANNLARLGSRRELYKDFVKQGNSDEKKIYKFKEATPEMLEKIRSYKIAENERLKKKRMWVMLGLSIIFLMIVFIALTI